MDWTFDLWSIPLFSQANGINAQRSDHMLTGSKAHTKVMS